MLRDSALDVVCEAELEPVGVKFWHQLNDVENADLRDDRLRCLQEPLLAASCTDQDSLGGRHRQRQLPGGIRCSSLVRTHTSPEDVLPHIGSVEPQFRGQEFQGYEIFGHDVPTQSRRGFLFGLTHV